jgi:CBS domain containing-hemolysin-like protein
VPETKTISELLAEFRRERLKLVIALDEYGGTAGLITLDDLLREVVGEMSDETDDKEPQRIKRLADGSTLIDASLRVAEVNEELGTSIPESESYETLAGAVLFELGRFPKGGETLELGGRHLVVTQSSDRRVLEVKLERAVAS